MKKKIFTNKTRTGGIKMTEYYDMIWRYEKEEAVIGELRYDLDHQKFSADLLDDAKDFPTLLFGIFAQGKKADDRKVRDYIDSCVISKNLPNIQEALEWMGLSEYDQWEIYKYNKGKNNHDLAGIRYRETK